MRDTLLALAGVLVPLGLAWIYRLPRRTLRLATEVEILSKLDPESPAYERFASHVNDLLEREVDENETTLQLYDFATWAGSLVYAIAVGLVGFRAGGFGWVFFGLSIAITAALGVVAGAWVRRTIERIRHRGVEPNGS